MATASWSTATVGEDEALFSTDGKSWDSTLNVKQR